MKKYKTVLEPEKKVKKYEFTVCDICGDQSRNQWAGSYDAFDATINIRTGTSYPEIGNGHEIDFDLCPTCINEKLIPWLESQGAKADWKEWDY